MAFTPIVEGATGNAASLNTPFTAVVATVNAIQNEAIKDHSLSPYNFSINLTPGVDSAVLSETVVHTYTNVWASDTDSTIGNPGWAVVTDGTTSLSETFSNTTIGMATASKIGAIDLLANVEVLYLLRGAQNPATTYPTICAALAFQIRAQDGATWYTVAKTARHIQADYVYVDTGASPGNYYTNMCKDVPMRTRITAADIAALGITGVTGARVVVAGNRTLTYDAGITVTVALGGGRLTVMPMFAGDP